jgi:hypothetical protein
MRSLFGYKRDAIWLKKQTYERVSWYHTFAFMVPSKISKRERGLDQALDDDKRLHKSARSVSAKRTAPALAGTVDDIVNSVAQFLSPVHRKRMECLCNHSKCWANMYTNSERLEFGNEFNSTIPTGALPAGLLELWLGNRFNQPLAPGVFPHKLQRLYFGDDFNQVIGPGVLPASIRLVILGVDNRKKLEQDALPEGLLTLRMYGSHRTPIPYPRIGQPHFFPSTLRTLYIGGRFNQMLHRHMFNPGLHSLKFGDDFNQEIPPFVLPEGLKHMITGDSFNQPIVQNALPAGLSHLKFGETFRQPLTEATLPRSLHTLLLKRYNDRLVPGLLPVSLVVLHLGSEYNQPLSRHVLPEGLHTLFFGYHFNQPLHKWVLPRSLLSLKLGPSFNEECECDSIPEGLHTLCLFRHWSGNECHAMQVQDIPEDGPILHLLPALLRIMNVESAKELMSTLKPRLPQTLKHVTLDGCCLFTGRIMW